MVDCDVIVVGAGLAGLVALYSGRQAGRTPLAIPPRKRG